MKKGGIKMKKIVSFLLFATLLVGCSNGNMVGDEADNASIESSSSKRESSTIKIKEVITNLNQPGEIIAEDNVMYTITVKEVIDVTEEAKNELINDTNYLDYISSGQGEQAVKITLIIENKSGEVLGMPYLDDVKVIDSSGITNVGGWKDESGSKTDFGYYNLDDQGNAVDDLYTVENNESRMATSTVVLANDSEKISFKFDSQKFGDYIDFELPVE